MSALIDTHIHLDAPEFDRDRDEVVAAARAAGIARWVVPTVSAATFASTLAMRERYGAAVAFGLHPLYLAEHTPEHLDVLDGWLAREPAVAVGEIGLDFFVAGLDPARQEALFAAQLELAKKHGLPVLLHVRRSVDRVLKYLRRQGIDRGIAHAFNGSREQADALIRQGFKLGFGGAMTYAGSRRIRLLAATLPLSSIVLETDAPDIPPEWAGGGRNEPANLARFAAVLAQLRGIDVAEVIDATGTNARAVLDLA